MDTELLSRLDDWARERHIWPLDFHCPHYEECKGSIKGLPTLQGGSTCSMSYVGKDYGQPVGGKPFKLVFVGIDRGWKRGGEGFAEAREGCEKAFYGGADKFNPHYLGVIRTAAVIFGQAGQYCLSRCFQQKKCDGDKRPDGERCVLRSFAQPNLAKCAPATEDMRSRATDLMLMKCAGHLVSELEILKPNLVVFHAADARWCFAPAVEKKGWHLSPVGAGPADRLGPVIHVLKANDFESHILFLHHPARGGLGRQWVPVVEPALTFLRSERAIPGQ